MERTGHAAYMPCMHV